MKKKLMALFLALSMAVSLVTPAFAAGGLVTSPSEVLASTPAGRAALLSAWDFEVFQKDDLDKAVEEATVNLFEKTQIMLGELDIPGVDFQWQIAVPDQDLWVDIQGEDKLGLDLSYAKVASLLNEDGEAQVRCEVSLGSLVFQGPIITVDVDEDAKPESEPVEEKEPVVLKGPEVVIHDSQPAEPEEPEAEEPAPEAPAPEAPVVPPAQQEPVVEPEVVPEVETEDPATELDRTGLDESVVAVYNHRAAPLTASTNLIVATETKALTKYDLTINYTLDGKQVADPYYASLAEGSSFDVTVKNPVVMGYQPSVGTLPSGVTYDRTTDSINIDIDNMQDTVNVNVVYQPAPVDYTVIHYKQNVEDDNYTLALRETLTEPTGTEVPEVAKNYDGFYALAYEHPNVAADGSTVVEIYYDRGYYLMNFDLGGGYGVEPIYARYGAPISVGTPTRAGYTFNGWVDEDGNSATIPTTMPAENTDYTAVWTSTESAKVSIVFWGENPNDEGYSYIETTEITAAPGQTITYGANQLICTKKVHTHSASCGFSCGYEAHTHDDSCYSCEPTHNHTIECYNEDEIGNAFSPSFGEWFVYGRGTEGSIGQSYALIFPTGNKYIYIDGTWYRYTGSEDVDTIVTPGCGKTEDVHVHNDDCLKCGKAVHVHDDNCVGCGEKAHEHTDACYLKVTALDTNLWKFVRSDTVTVAADGSTVLNVYFDRTEFTLTFKQTTRDGGATLATITEKWGADIKKEFEEISEKNTFLWSSTSDGSSPWTSFIDVMPAENRTYYANTTSTQSTHTATYLGQKLGGTVGNASDYDVLYTTSVQYEGKLTVSKEEFEEIEGFTFNESMSTNIGSTYNGAKFYYDRNSYDLVFNDGYNVVNEKRVQFEAPLSTYAGEAYIPKVPSAYEPNSVEFDGWYLNPECSGEEYDLTKHTMPAENVLLYAKWSPVGHTVEFYLTKDAYEANTPIGNTHPTVTVPHGTIMETLPATPQYNGYEFVGWFYMENGVEKAIDFANMPVNKDLKVYGKWNSSILAKYTVYYKVKGTDIQIAEPTTGSGLVGNTKTFDAKGDEELKEGYRDGYYPVVKSHSMTLEGTEAKNVFTFEYVKADPVPYTVYYVTDSQNEAGTRTEVTLNGETYYIVSPTKIVTDNPKAVVTENFVPVSDMIPDAYQKRLVLSVNADGTPKTDENVIIFHYTEDSTHAYYKITHYTQNVSGTGWDEYTYSQAIGTIKQTYTADPLTISGFTFDPKIEGTVQSGVLEKEGLELKLYYTRNQYPYQVRYLEQITGKQLAAPKSGNGYYDQLITEKAITIDHYTVVAPNTQSMNLYVETGDEAKLNVITFFYTENVAKINYAVGSSGGGTVVPASESVKVLTGVPRGSIATANSGYTFAGWYTDAACTNPVEASWLDGTRIVPTKDESAAWVDGTTYYAKFVENEVTIKYQAVGPENATNFGSVSPQNETLAIYTGTAKGSTAIAGDGYKFDGWYDNEECTGTAISTDANFVPEKVDNKNVAATYYAKFEEKQVTINYAVVGPDNCGTVSPTSETVNAVTGTANGSTAKATSNVYKFVGWYSDEACTNRLTTDAHYTPTKAEDAIWPETTTFYAKFDYNLTSLKITKSGGDDIDQNQTFLFHVTGNGVDMDVVITGIGSVTIDGLTVGATYTVTEKTDWSWRYAPTDGEQEVTLVADASDNEVEFVNTKSNSKWLSAVTKVINTWTDNGINRNPAPTNGSTK